MRLLAGKPLVAHTVEQARASGLFTNVAVSSDSEEILSIAKEFGADVLVAEVGMDAELAALVVTACTQRGKELAEQQAKEREEAERLKAEEEAAADGVLGSGDAPVEATAEAAVDSILGGDPVAPSEDAPAEEASVEEAVPAEGTTQEKPAS